MLGQPSMSVPRSGDTSTSRSCTKKENGTKRKARARYPAQIAHFLLIAICVLLIWEHTAFEEERNEAADGGKEGVELVAE